MFYTSFLSMENIEGRLRKEEQVEVFSVSWIFNRLMKELTSLNSRHGPGMKYLTFKSPKSYEVSTSIILIEQMVNQSLGKFLKPKEWRETRKNDFMANLCFETNSDVVLQIEKAVIPTTRLKGFRCWKTGLLAVMGLSSCSPLNSLLK